LGGFSTLDLQPLDLQLFFFESKSAPPTYLIQSLYRQICHPGLILPGAGGNIMIGINRAVLILSITAILSAGSVQAEDFMKYACRVVVYDETVELEDSRLDVDLARSRFDAYEKIFRMIEGLWEGGTIPRMDYIKAKYDQDAARLQLERYGLILERQAALVEQYRLICGDKDSDKDKVEKALRSAYLKYRRADCGALAKGIEVASTNLEYNREYLDNILKLRREKFATNTQVVLAGLDVELEEKNLADATRRAAACREELEGIEAEPLALFSGGR